jgi:ribosomal protein S18 acetylase RimI-like enzyme
MAFTIVRAGPGDFQNACEAVLEVHGRSPLDGMALVEFLADDARYLLLAIEDGRVVGSVNGYALFRPHTREPQFFLYEIDVRPECRRRGIGKALVAGFVAAARAAKAGEVWVLTNQSNEAAMALYGSCGLRREHSDDVMWNCALP